MSGTVILPFLFKKSFCLKKGLKGPEIIHLHIVGKSLPGKKRGRNRRNLHRSLIHMENAYIIRFMM